MGPFASSSTGNGGRTRGDGFRDQAQWAKGNPQVLLFSAEGKSAWNWEKVLKDLNSPEADWSLRVLHAVQKKNRDALAETLKETSWAKAQGKAEEALRSLREQWGMVHPKIVERWATKAYALLAFLRHSRSVCRYLYTTKQRERLEKEVKRRTQVVEVFCGEGVVEKLLYLVLGQLDEAWGVRRLRGLAEIQIGNYRVALAQSMGHHKKRCVKLN